MAKQWTAGIALPGGNFPVDGAAAITKQLQTKYPFLTAQWATRIIQSDSSYSMDEISEFVNLSRNACWRRIRRMEEAGIIKARVALVEPSSINLGLSAFVMIRTNSHDTSWAEKFDKVVKCFPEIIGAHRMAGAFIFNLFSWEGCIFSFSFLKKNYIGII